MVYVKDVAKRLEEPSCYLTTGFFNSLFSTVKKQHIREVKCIAAEDTCVSCKSYIQ